jgi:hypothetical protein
MHSEIELNVDRCRQIVSRQRELVAKFGGWPIAAELLKTFEETLGILEQMATDRRSKLHLGTEQPAPPKCLEPADAITEKERPIKNRCATLPELWRSCAKVDTLANLPKRRCIETDVW